MSAKSQGTPTEWVDPDDAPELTDEFFDRATPMVGGRVASFDEFAAAARKELANAHDVSKGPSKVAVTVRYSPEVIDAFRATGRGWQSRMDEALKEWLRTHSPA